MSHLGKFSQSNKAVPTFNGLPLELKQRILEPFFTILKSCSTIRMLRATISNPSRKNSTPWYLELIVPGSATKVYATIRLPHDFAKVLVSHSYLEAVSSIYGKTARVGVELSNTPESGRQYLTSETTLHTAIITILANARDLRVDERSFCNPVNVREILPVLLPNAKWVSTYPTPLDTSISSTEDCQPLVQLNYEEAKDIYLERRSMLESGGC